MKRRDALKTLGALAGAASLPRVLTGCGDSDSKAAGVVDTYVFLMMENRSYDHALGARSMLEGKPGDGLRADMKNPDRLGVDIPIWAVDPTQDMCVIDPPHGWDAARTQFAGGQNSGFLLAHQGDHDLDSAIEPMQYLQRVNQPVSWALADAYTSCDRWFSSVLGPTLPNRMYWHAGSSNGAKTNGDVLAGAFNGIPTIYHRLNDKAVNWTYYYGDIPVVSAVEDLDKKGHVKPFLYDFLDDAAAGTLAPVVYINPSYNLNDDHPPRHPWMGQQLISAVYQALATSPQWERCMLIITYDENGGFFDHVAPPSGRPDDHAADGFDQLGFRVPALAIGPYAKQGYVSSVQLEHTSPLRHITDLHGLEPINQRVSAANPLDDLFDLERLAAGEPAPPIQLPAVDIDETMLPDVCTGGGAFKPEEHDVLAWAAADRNLRPYLERRDPNRALHGIAEYLDKHGLGRIRRR